MRVWVYGGECIVGRHAPQLAYMEASCCKAKCFVRARAKGSDKAACLAAYRFAAGVCFECGKVGEKQKARSGGLGCMVRRSFASLRMTVRNSG